jgi:transcriptional regulator with XRE-family HTH domain
MGTLTLDELRAMTAAYRKERNLSQRAFAMHLKISPSSLCRFEAGERTLTPKHLRRLCEYLGMKYDPAKLKMLVTCPRCLHRFV